MTRDEYDMQVAPLLALLGKWRTLASDLDQADTPNLLRRVKEDAARLDQITLAAIKARPAP